MKVAQKPSFKRVYKKLHNNQRQAVNLAIRSIIENPKLDEEKKGDLAGIFVHKFDCVNQQYLLAYQWRVESRTLLMLGVHENYYKKLKQ